MHSNCNMIPKLNHASVSFAVALYCRHPKLNHTSVFSNHGPKLFLNNANLTT